MKQFLQAVIPQAPLQPHPPQPAAAARARQRKRGAGASTGSKKRRMTAAGADGPIPLQSAAPAVSAAVGQDPEGQPAMHPTASKAHARKQAVPRRAPTPDAPNAGQDAAEQHFQLRRSDDEGDSAAEY